MRIESIDFFKSIAMFAIIVLHTSPFHGSDISGCQLLDAFLNQASRFAVPYFFIVSGYFFGLKIRSGTLPGELFWVYLKRLFPLFLLWSIIYLILPTDIKKQVLEYGLWQAIYQKMFTIISDPITLLFEGSRGHLWFLISLLMAFGILTIFLKFNKKHFILPVAALLYFLGLMAGSYSATPIGINLSFNTRNGPFLSTLFVTIGWCLSSEKYKLRPIYALGLALFGIVLHMFETYILWRYFNTSPLLHDFLLGTPLFVIGLTMFALSRPNLFESSLITKWGRYTLGIYLLHLLVVDMLTPLDKIIPFPLWDIIYPFIAFFISLFLVFMLLKSNILKYMVAY